jgi:hypothetical protein
MVKVCLSPPNKETIDDLRGYELAAPRLKLRPHLKPRTYYLDVPREEIDLCPHVNPIIVILG